MTSVNEYFDERVGEVNQYFELLRVLDEPGVSLLGPDKARPEITPVGSDLHRMMKASSFLLLYNLIESTTRRAFEEVYQEVRRGGNYRKLTAELRTEWLRRRCKPLSDPSSRASTFERYASLLIDEVLRDAVIDLGSDPNWLRGSGNLDADRLRALCADHGIPLKVDHDAKGGIKLSTVKNMRNTLAHGDLLFSEVGRDFTYGQLNEIKHQVILYMRSLLHNIDRFVETQSYLGPNNAG